jgi:hypothetical protein
VSDQMINPPMRRLIDSAISGRLTDEEQTQLDEALRCNDEALAVYLNYCQLETDLFFYARATLAERRVLSDIERSESALVEPSALQSKVTATPLRSFVMPTRWLASLAAVLLLGIGLLLGAIGNHWISTQHSPKVALNSWAGEGPIVKAYAPYEARLMQGTACVWAPDMRSRLDSLKTLHSGDSLNLIAGLAELQLSWPMRGDVTLRLEGPAGLVLMTEGGASLNYGKLTANVSLQYDSFVIETPVGRVVANNSSNVGVAASSGDVEVHVFAGEAELLVPWASSSQETRSLRVHAGRSIRIKPTDNGNVEVVRGPAAAGRFASELSMSSDLLEISDTYVDAIKKAGPLLYWRMETPINDVIKNTVGSQYKARAWDQPNWVEERGNMSVEFGAGLDADKWRALVMTDEPIKQLNTDAYTIELWAKPSHYHWGTMVSLARPPEKNKVPVGLHGVLLELGGRSLIYSGIEHPGRVRFLHRSPPSADANAGTSCFSDQPYGLRKWQHIVAVKQNSQMRLYLDSKLLATAEDNTPLSGDFELVVGQIDRERNMRPFFGQVDELAFYTRALSEEEITQHYRIVRPKPVSKRGI